MKRNKKIVSDMMRRAPKSKAALAIVSDEGYDRMYMLAGGAGRPALEVMCQLGTEALCGALAQLDGYEARKHVGDKVIRRVMAVMRGDADCKKTRCDDLTHEVLEDYRQED